MPSKRTPSMTASYENWCQVRISAGNIGTSMLAKFVHDTNFLRGNFLRRRALDPHFLQRLADGGGGVAQLVRVDRPDAADAEGLDPRELAGIQDVAARAHFLVERLERIRRVRGRVEGHDDGRLHALREERLEAEGRHRIDQRIDVAAVARPAGARSALGLELVERRAKG